MTSDRCQHISVLCGDGSRSIVLTDIVAPTSGTDGTGTVCIMVAEIEVVTTWFSFA